METDFSKSFTNIQKIAIFNVLLSLLSQDDKMSRDKEIKQLIQILEILNFDIWSPIIQFQVHSSFQISDDIETLNSLTKNQKEWMIVSALSVVRAGGTIGHSKQNLINNLCESLGISNDELDKIIIKMVTLQKMKRESFKGGKSINNSGCLVVLMFLVVSLVSIFFIL